MWIVVVAIQTKVYNNRYRNRDTTMTKIKFIEKNINEADALKLLKESSNSFYPPLSTEVNLISYSKKLSKYAKFIFGIEEGEAVGYIAFYLNDKEKQIYIPLICVSPKYQHMGIGTKMLSYLESLYKGQYETVGLEVVKENMNAYNFYVKQGFEVNEDRGSKFLMLKNIE